MVMDGDPSVAPEPYGFVHLNLAYMPRGMSKEGWAIMDMIPEYEEPPKGADEVYRTSFLRSLFTFPFLRSPFYAPLLRSTFTLHFYAPFLRSLFTPPFTLPFYAPFLRSLFTLPFYAPLLRSLFKLPFYAPFLHSLFTLLFYAPFLHSLFTIIERYVSNVFYSERIVRVFYSQSDKILGVFYPK